MVSNKTPCSGMARYSAFTREQRFETFAIALAMSFEHCIVDAVRAVHDQRWLPRHAAEQRGLPKRRDEVLERIAVCALRAERWNIAARSCDPLANLAAQRLLALAVRPTVREHLVEPQLQQRRHAVPVHRMLPDHD